MRSTISFLSLAAALVLLVFGFCAAGCTSECSDPPPPPPEVTPQKVILVQPEQPDVFGADRYGAPRARRFAAPRRFGASPCEETFSAPAPRAASPCEDVSPMPSPAPVDPNVDPFGAPRRLPPPPPPPPSSSGSNGVPPGGAQPTPHNPNE